MTGTEIYKRTDKYEKESREIRLLAPQWKVLLAFDGQRTLSEVALSAETSFAESIPLTQKFLDSAWIEECPITLDQYMKRLGAKDISKTGAMVSPAVVLHDPKKTAPVPVTPPAATPSASTPVSVPAPVTPKPLVPPPQTLSGTIPPPLPVAPAPPAKPPETANASAKETKPNRAPMKLSSVVDFICSLVGNISLGQILVYRVFLRVPPELLLAEDVASVHLSNDTSLVKSEKLQKAIREAVLAVTKRNLPESVFAAA